jgi:hypothetical protein
MTIPGNPPISLSLDHASEARFCYWHGASGRRYIHTIYPAGCCPPLPGAVFIAVKRTGTLRTALAVGRFSVFWDMGVTNDFARGADELHVHLLARDDEDAGMIVADLAAALQHSPSRSRQARVPSPAFQADGRGCQVRADVRPC